MGTVIVGAAMTRFGKFVETTPRELASSAANRALDDAGLTGEDIDLVVFGNAAAGLITGQEMIRAHTGLSDSRVAGRPMISMENACASSSSAFHFAELAVRSGSYDRVLVVGAEKMTSTEPGKAATALASALDVERTESGTDEPVFMRIYADEAIAYMDRTGTSTRDIARVAAKNSRNGRLNENAQRRQELTVEEVLAARRIVEPLTRPMCSSIGDGAAALVVTRAELVDRNAQAAVTVLASAVGAASAGDNGDVVARTAAAAYEQAGLGPSELDVCEVHDAAAVAELVIAEELGIAAIGDGAALVRRGTTDLGGATPVNPSGGLIARGHPIGATGAAQLVELTEQLRGRSGDRQVDNVRIALAENAGGSLGLGPAACAVTILGSG